MEAPKWKPTEQEREVMEAVWMQVKGRRGYVAIVSTALEMLRISAFDLNLDRLILLSGFNAS